MCGSPGSGKTTYVLRNKLPHDLVIDLDYICAALMGESGGVRLDFRAVLPDSIRSAQAALSVYTAEAREVGAGFCGNSNSRRAGNAQACAGA